MPKIDISVAVVTIVIRSRCRAFSRKTKESSGDESKLNRGSSCKRALAFDILHASRKLFGECGLSKSDVLGDARNQLITGDDLDANVNLKLIF